MQPKPHHKPLRLTRRGELLLVILVAVSGAGMNQLWMYFVR